MERIAQILDDLDDLISMICLVGERIRTAVLMFLGILAATAVVAGGILLALANPPLALAVAVVLFVWLLYHAVTSPRLEIAS